MVVRPRRWWCLLLLLLLVVVMVGMAWQPWRRRRHVVCHWLRWCQWRLTVVHTVTGGMGREGWPAWAPAGTGTRSPTGGSLSMMRRWPRVVHTGRVGPWPGREMIMWCAGLPRGPSGR
jgi:hypothetical protein